MPDAYNAADAVVWDTPLPFDEYDLPAFSTDALPETIRRYVLAVAESTQTSVDMAAIEALGVVSLCSQGKYFVRGNADWSEPLNTYTVVVLSPAERKSSVLSMMIRPVELFEMAENTRHGPEIVKSQMELSQLEKEKRSLVERASKGKATEEEVRAKATEIAKYEPVKPLRLFVDDVTSEKLTSVPAENKGCAAVVSAEGGIFDIISGLYSRNVNIDVFLKGHPGRQNRQGQREHHPPGIDHGVGGTAGSAEWADEQQHIPWSWSDRPIPVLHAKVHRGQPILLHEADPGRSQSQVSGSD